MGYRTAARFLEKQEGDADIEKTKHRKRVFIRITLTRVKSWDGWREPTRLGQGVHRADPLAGPLVRVDGGWVGHVRVVLGELYQRRELVVHAVADPASV